MKRIITIIILSSLLAFVTGCANADNVIDVAPPSTPAPLVLDAPLPQREPAAPAPDPDPLNAGPGIYTFAWLTDTQHYSEENPDTFLLMSSYLSRERERQNIVYAVHTGDLVQNFQHTYEWELASRAMQLVSVPYGVCAGNHDVDYSNADYERFCKYFGESRFSDMPCYGDGFGDNRCHYDLVTAGGTDYIFVYIGYALTDEGISWVNRAFEAHPERVGVLCTHDYFKTDMSLSDSGERLFNDVGRANANLYMVLCGHRYNIANVVSEIDDRTVLQIMGNYQAAGSFGGGGYMRFIQIDEAQKLMRIYSYSPLYDDYRYFDNPGSEDEKYSADPAYEYVELPLPWA